VKVITDEITTISSIGDSKMKSMTNRESQTKYRKTSMLRLENDKESFLVRDNGDQTRSKITLRATGVASAAIGVMASVHYTNTPLGLDQEAISKFLPHPNTPISETNFIAAHNAFTNHDALGNQQYSTTWLLNNTPTRGFQLDIKKDSKGSFFIEHDLHGLASPPALEKSLGEINTWLNDNPDQIIMIDIDSEPSLRNSPKLAQTFREVFGAKLNNVEMENPTIMDMTARGCQVVFRQNDLWQGSEWEKFQFIKPNNILAHNDSAPFFFGRGFSSVDKEAFEWSDINKHFITSEELSEYSRNQNGTLFNLDQINKYTFKRPEGFESDPTIGPFRTESTIGNTTMLGLATGKMSFSVIGPAAVIALQYHSIHKKIDELLKDPSQLDDEVHKQLVQQVAKLGLSATASSTNALITAAIIYPSLFDPLGIAAAATAGIGALGTLIGVNHTHRNLKNIRIHKGRYQFWPFGDKDSKNPNVHSEAEVKRNNILIDRTSDKEKLHHLLNVISTFSILMRFSSTTKYFLPGVAPFAAGVGVGLTIAMSTLDGFSHNKMIDSFIANPQKALAYYKSKSVQEKKWMFWGHSEVTRFLDKNLKTAEDAREQLNAITHNAEGLKNGHEVLWMLTSTKEDFLHNEMRHILKMFNSEEIQSLNDSLHSSRSITSEAFSNLIGYTKVKKSSEVAISILISRLTHLTDKWNIWNRIQEKDTHKQKEKLEFKNLNENFKSFWENFNNYYTKKMDSQETFQQSFMNKLIAREEYLLKTMQSVSRGFEEDALRQFAQKSVKVPKWLETTIESYLKLPTSFKKENPIRGFINSKITQHYLVKASLISSKKKYYDDKTKKTIDKLDLILEQAIKWKIKKVMRNDMRKHGFADTAQISIGLGSLGIIFPPISGYTFSAASGTMAFGALVTEIVARRKSNKWEKKYDSLIKNQTHHNNTKSNIIVSNNTSFDTQIFKKVGINIKGRGSVLFYLKDGEIFRCREDNQNQENPLPLVIENNGSKQCLKFNAIRGKNDRLQLISRNGDISTLYELSWDKFGNKMLSVLTPKNGWIKVNLAEANSCLKKQIIAPVTRCENRKERSIE
jgi:hypothetical protein